MGKVFDHRSGQPYSPDGFENGAKQEFGLKKQMIFSALRRSLPASRIDREVNAEEDPDRAGIIFAGVHCWGESVLEQVCPRPLLPIIGRPLISYGLEWLRNGGVRSVTLCANCQTTEIREHLGDGRDLGMVLDYYEDPMPRGPAGCLRDAALRSNAGTFVVVDGSIVTMIDLEELIEAHAASGAALTVVVRGPEGSAEMDSHPLEPEGIYVVSRSVIEQIPANGYQDIKQALIPRLYESGLRVVPHIVPGSMTLRVTGAASYATVASRMVEHAVCRQDLSNEYQRIGKAWVHRSSNLEPRSRLVGEVIIGPNCLIGEGVTIVGPTSIGSGCVIDSRAVITRSVIWSDCRIGRAAFVDRCILADGAKVEPELVVRETVWLPANRQPLGLLDRISPFRTLLPEKVKRWDSGPLPAAFDQVSRAISSNH